MYEILKFWTQEWNTTIQPLGSINSHCSGNESTIAPRERKAGPEAVAETKPNQTYVILKLKEQCFL